MNHELTYLQPVHNLRDLPSTGLPEICVSGRSNVGKSSLLNALAGRKNLAKISQTPGKTRALQYFIADGIFYLVDMPGYGYAKTAKTERELFARLVNSYLKDRKELRGIIQLIDSRHGPVSGDIQMIEWLMENGLNVLYVLTKSDKLSTSDKMKALKKYRKVLGTENIILFSARDKTGVDDIWKWIGSVLGLQY